MNAYDQLRQHYRDLPELPGADEAADWTPDDPQAIKATICRRNVWGYVPIQVRARLGKLLAELAAAAAAERPADLSLMTFDERWASYPASMSFEDRLRRDIETYEALTGPENVRIVSTSEFGPAIAWHGVNGWTPERYQPLARSIGRWGRDQPLHDDPFGQWEKDEHGRWRRANKRITWASMGGYDPARGPWRGPCTHYPISRRWLEDAGPGPWQITVTGYFDGRGVVYGNLIEWPLEGEAAHEPPAPPAHIPEPPPEETPPDPEPEEAPDEPYAELVETVRDYLEATGRPEAYFDRWRRVLAGLGAEGHDNPMTAAEAQSYHDRGWGPRWAPIAAALREIEAR